MSILNLIRLKLGASITPANNFTFDASADNGTMRLYRGNAGTPIQDVLTVNNDGGVKLNTAPAFSAYQSVLQSVPHATDTKILFQSEEFDTASCYDTSLSRFQPNVAGYYQINATVFILGNASRLICHIWRNNILHKFGTQYQTAGGAGACVVTGLVFLNGTTDYVEIKLFHDQGAAQNTIVGAAQTYFQGHMVRAA